VTGERAHSRFRQSDASSTDHKIASANLNLPQVTHHTTESVMTASRFQCCQQAHPAQALPK
jgi:hypothetical protein